MYLGKATLDTGKLDLGLVSAGSNKVLKCDVIKIKFLKLWDLSGYSERTTSKRPRWEK